jgi:hypothetical protein
VSEHSHSVQDIPTGKNNWKRSSHYSMEELTRMLHDQELILSDSRRSVELLNQKVQKLEELVAIKDKKIESLQRSLALPRH